MADWPRSNDSEPLTLRFEVIRKAVVARVPGILDTQDSYRILRVRMIRHRQGPDSLSGPGFFPFIGTVVVRPSAVQVPSVSCAIVNVEPSA